MEAITEDIRQFLAVNPDSGAGYGDSSGHGITSGYGDGCSYGYSYDYMNGSGYIDGCGFGAGYGPGHGSDCGTGAGSSYSPGCIAGDGSGRGYGSGFGNDSGNGDGDGYNHGVKTCQIQGISHTIYLIDDIPTIITATHGNTAQGYIFHSDFVCTPCFVVKENDTFAHGGTLHEAYAELQEKLLNSMSIEERVAKFKAEFPDYDAKIPATKLFSWHHILTGSCEMGRRSFCQDHGIDIESDSFTVKEFIALTKDSYGGDVIKRL
jgi:hypothetical protein